MESETELDEVGAALRTLVQRPNSPKLQAFAQNSGARLLFLTAGMLAVQRIVMIYCTRAGLVPPDHLSEGARDYMSAVDFLTALAVCTYFTYW